jgi:hypothetical protein
VQRENCDSVAEPGAFSPACNAALCIRFSIEAQQHVSYHKHSIIPRDTGLVDWEEGGAVGACVASGLRSVRRATLHIVSVNGRALNCTEQRKCQPTLHRACRGNTDSSSVSVCLSCPSRGTLHTVHTTTQYTVRSPYNKFRRIPETDGWVRSAPIATARPQQFSSF